MKKIILFIAIITCSISHTQAQLRAGIKAGGLLSNLHTFQKLEIYPNAKLNQLHDNKLGIQFGFFMQKNLADKLILQPELLWVNQGMQISTSQKQHYNYVSLPILLGYQPFEHFSILMGPNVAVLSSANESYGLGFRSNIKDRLHSKADIGINLGIDYQLKNGLGFGLRYNRGLITAKKLLVADPNGEITASIPYKNHSLQCYVSYAFLK